MTYHSIRPTATYSPWTGDYSFIEFYESIQSHTLVDIYRCWELWKLVEQSAKLQEGHLLEVGVWRGGTGALIAKQAGTCGIPGTVLLCDTFTGVVKTGPEDSEYRGGEHADTSFAIVADLLLNKLDLPNVNLIEGIFPDQTGQLYENLKFRFCHIDVDTYQSAKDVLAWVWPRLVPGGIVVYDDYGFETCSGVTKHVDEIAQKDDRLFIYNLNGHAILIKLY